MQKEKNIAIFDLDGTLVETDAANGAAYRRAMEIVGLRQPAGLFGRVTAETVLAAMGLNVADMAVVARAKVEAYRRELWRTRLGPAADALKRVLANRSAFAKVVLLTDSHERRAWETLAHWGLARHFDEIVCNGGHGDKYANYFGGLLVSEYFRDARSRREFIGRYAERDRLQSMFAESVVLAASYAQRDFGKDSGSRFAMGKAAEYGVPRYVVYDTERDSGDPMFNLSRDEIASGASVIKPEDVASSSVLKARNTTRQLGLGL